MRASDGSVWTIGSGVRQRHGNATVTHSWYRAAEVVSATAADLALPTGDPWTLRPGTVLKVGSTFWIYADGVRRQFVYHSLYGLMGYVDAGALTAPTADVASIRVGTPIV